MREYLMLQPEEQEQLRKQRITELEHEHFANVLSLEQENAKPKSKDEGEAKKQEAEVARLEDNIVVIDSMLDAISAEV